MIVKRIRPLPLTRVMAAIYAAIALAQMHGGGEPWMGAFIGILALVGAPIFYGLLGFLGGLFTAGAYNLAAGGLGGVELEVEDR